MFYLCIKLQTLMNGKELELKKDKELSYAGEFTLLYDNDYEYKIVIKGDKTESRDVEELDKIYFCQHHLMLAGVIMIMGYILVLILMLKIVEKTSNENKIKTIEIIV